MALVGAQQVLIIYKCDHYSRKVITMPLAEAYSVLGNVRNRLITIITSVKLHHSQ